MGLFAEDPSLITTNLLYQTAFVLAVLRWVFSLVLKLSASSIESFDDTASCCCSSSSLSPQMIRDNLELASFEEVKDRAPWVSDTCAVCLNQLTEKDEVRELRNCCHVFHRECIDRWVEYDHDNHHTCPLCRAPLVAPAQTLGWARNEPSWAVEHLLYLLEMTCSLDLLDIL